VGLEFSKAFVLYMAPKIGDHNATVDPQEAKITHPAGARFTASSDGYQRSRFFKQKVVQPLDNVSFE